MSSIVVKRLKKIRNVKKLSQKEFADYLGVSFGAYKKWEYEERTPDIDSLVKIADKLGINADWLLGRTDYITILCKDEDIKKIFK